MDDVGGCLMDDVTVYDYIDCSALRNDCIKKFMSWGYDTSVAYMAFSKLIPGYTLLIYSPEEIRFYEKINSVHGYALFRAELAAHGLTVEDLR